jgi:hypothetical protein
MPAMSSKLMCHTDPREILVKNLNVVISGMEDLRNIDDVSRQRIICKDRINIPYIYL